MQKKIYEFKLDEICLYIYKVGEYNIIAKQNTYNIIKNKYHSSISKNQIGKVMHSNTIYLLKDSLEEARLAFLEYLSTDIIDKDTLTQKELMKQIMRKLINNRAKLINEQENDIEK